jgi:ribonuclease BN (tRNA processing enzyme)
MRYMQEFKLRIYLTVIAIGLAMLAACAKEQLPAAIDIGTNPDLAAHTAEFRQEVIKVTDGVYVAIGFGLANCILLEGDDGVVIVDAMESVEAAIPVKEAFSKITTKPVKAIIYTHYHADHIMGATVMAGEDHPDIYSHATTSYYLDRIATITRETTYRRAMRQFGTRLPEGGIINAGIGPRLEYDESKTLGVLIPNKTFSEDHFNLEIAGLSRKLLQIISQSLCHPGHCLPGRQTLGRQSRQNACLETGISGAPAYQACLRCRGDLSDPDQLPGRHSIRS